MDVYFFGQTQLIAEFSLSSPLDLRHEIGARRVGYFSFTLFCLSTALLVAGFALWLQHGVLPTVSSTLILPALLYCFGHFARMVRLGIIIGKVRIRSLFTLYLYVASLSFFTPFKLGDFFRINELGAQTGSYARGFLIVWVERAFDMFALGIIILLSLNHGTGGISAIGPFLWLIGMFVLMSVSFFFILPEQLPSLNLHVMRTYKGEKAIRALKVLSATANLCRSGIQLLAGRFMTLAFVTTVIWGFEVAAFTLLIRNTPFENSVFDLLRYYSELITQSTSDQVARNVLFDQFHQLKILLIVIPGMLVLPLYAKRRWDVLGGRQTASGNAGDRL